MKKLIENRTLILDGAMGTQINKQGIDPTAYVLYGNKADVSDVFNITAPDVIEKIHAAYIAAGADIIETNTFNSNGFSLADYCLSDYVYEINHAGAELARRVAEKESAKYGRAIFVAGSIGPSNKSASLLKNSANPAEREVNFDEIINAYSPQIKGLIDGGVDILLIETVFDTLVCKAILFAIETIFQESKQRIPIMISVTLMESGRTLSGQTLEAFYNSIKHAKPFCIGLNCSFGAEQMYPYVRQLASIADCYVHAYPNAGLPNEFGEYDETPESMAKKIEPFLKEGLVNIIGGCCGTSPKHINEIDSLANKFPKREIPQNNNKKILAGLDVFEISKSDGFIKIGERTNTAGSRKFARLIDEQKYSEAVEVARHQIENGAEIIDISLDSIHGNVIEEMGIFINYLLNEPDIAKVPFMIDSSNWDVIKSALKLIQGKCIINSISLEKGEQAFIEKVEYAKKMGAAIVVMLFDEQGQATSYERKIAIAERVMNVLTSINFEMESIIIDPNILAIGTGIKEHDVYAIETIKAIRWIKQHYPNCSVSGGLSNLSFAYRGNDLVRNALHAIFMKYASEAGMDMAIVNPQADFDITSYPQELQRLAEDLILCRNDNAAIALAEYKPLINNTVTVEKIVAISKNLTLEELIITGKDIDLHKAIENEIAKYDNPLEVINTPMLSAMQVVSSRFISGEMFLPQLIKSAMVMKKAAAYIEDKIASESGNVLEKEVHAKGKVLLATVRGDVHDIGKNIVALVLSCAGYDVIDAGIMVAPEKIVELAQKEKPDIIGLSGLIAPSLEEMITVADCLQDAGVNIPVLLGGAAVSKEFTAKRLYGKYAFDVVYIKDAAECAMAISALLSDNKSRFIAKLNSDYQFVQNKSKNASRQVCNCISNQKTNILPNQETDIPKRIGTNLIRDISAEKVHQYFNWKIFNRFWRVNTYSKEFDELQKDAERFYNEVLGSKVLKYNAVIGLYSANSDKTNVLINKGNEQFNINFEMPDGGFGLANNIANIDSGKADYMGMFALSIEIEQDYFGKLNEYEQLLIDAISCTEADALSDYLCEKVRADFWATPAKISNPAPGYAICPNHALKKSIFEILDVSNTIGVELTENYAMVPKSSICGFYFIDKSGS